MSEEISKQARFLEGVIRFSLAIYYVTTSILFKFIPNRPRKIIPSATNPLLLQSASELARKIRLKEVKSVDVVEIFIRRIEETNPLLNYVVEDRFSEALKDAKEVDDFLASTEKSLEEIEEDRPFLGVPITIKESLAVKGLSHTSGVVTRAHVKAEKDAVVVELMRAAGAIPIAVTNTPEICCWHESFNRLHGRTSNPYHSSHTPGGSSGGEAAAISSASSLIGLGSDFAGSIRVPALFTGIFGHKPSSNTVSLTGHYPVPDNPSLQKLLVTGPLTRYSTDLRPMMKVLTKHYNPSLTIDRKIDFKTLRVYYMDYVKDPFGISQVQPEIQKEIRKVTAHLKSLGASVEKIDIALMKYAPLYWFAKVKTDDGPQIGKYLGNYKEAVNIVVEAFKMLFGATRFTYPIITFGVLEACNGVQYKGTLHTAVLTRLEKVQGQLKTLMKDDGVFLFPTFPTSAPKHTEPIGNPFDLGYAAVINAMEFPATHCPTGFDSKGLPIGLQVIANHGYDHLTISVAEELERAFGGWKPPYS